MVSYVSALLYGVGGIVVAGMALLVAFQEKLVYVPVLPGLSKSYQITPDRLRLLYEDVWLMSSDGVRLHSWFIKLFPDCKDVDYAGKGEENKSEAKLQQLVVAIRPTVLFFQENAGNIAHRLEMVHVMLQKLQCNVFMLSYRGYGASDGFPSQHGITKDAQAALDHLVQRADIDTSRIIVFGRSLGGAVGAVLTKNNPDKVAALILENTFTSILDMAGVLLPFLKLFIGKSTSKGPRVLNFLVRSPWNTIDVVGEKQYAFLFNAQSIFQNVVVALNFAFLLSLTPLIKQPILFLSGLRDEMVPPSHMEMLYAKAAARNRQCFFVEFPTGMHMDTWLAGGDRYWRTIQEFLAKTVPEKKNSDSSRVGNFLFSIVLNSCVPSVFAVEIADPIIEYHTSYSLQILKGGDLLESGVLRSYIFPSPSTILFLQ
ncbi:alpha/beta-Hydrolases superfamily protein [Striga asiatica]|uniref:Alpha/beta-Hydrolases superfamily protein n=1 Tax=Striga asiatica TaxID=4170 RepID=A0A5A7PVA3_STRAF|nr:alpha/beta-Hydrolases superfamily protein [Striga asiatica]